MLIWMCALRCEAKPIIDFFRLKKSADKTDFNLYSNHDMTCIVSGMGSDNMSKATEWAYSLYKNEKKVNWINIGIAGHKNLPVGTTVLINEVSQNHSDKSIENQITIKHPFNTKPLISISQQNTDYDKTALFDMEAFAFLQTTRKLCPLDPSQVIKVVSDNRQTPPSQNKARISKLIADNMQPISDFAFRLITNRTL